MPENLGATQTGFVTSKPLPTLLKPVKVNMPIWSVTWFQVPGVPLASMASADLGCGLCFGKPSGKTKRKPGIIKHRGSPVLRHNLMFPQQWLILCGLTSLHRLGRADSPRSEVTQAKQREQQLSRTPHSPTLSFGLWAHDERQLHHLGLAPLYLKQPLISRLQDLHGSIPKYPQLLPPACRNATCAARGVNVWWKPSGPSQPFPHNNKLNNKEHKHIGSLTYWKHSSFLGKVSMRNFINYWMTFK